MTSDEGLNAYGAATWGQFFIYQGFNERAGWMHTSSGVDNVDEFAEKVERKGKGRLLSLRHAVPPARREPGHHPLPRKGRHASQPRLHDLADPPRPDRPGSERPLDRLRDDGQARRGAPAELPPHQDARPQGLPQGRRSQGQQLEQHHLRQREGRDRLSASAVRAEAQRPLRLSQAGRRQRPRHRLGRPARDRRAAERDQPAERLGAQRE